MNAIAENVTLALPNESVALVRALLRLHAPEREFFAFGSRVIGHQADLLRLKPHSDLDLAIVGETLPLEQLFALREAFSESDLPMRVDIVHERELPSAWKIRAWRF